MAETNGTTADDTEVRPAGSGMIHPFSRYLYELDGQGAVRVVDGDRWGRFTLDGRWIEGEIRSADPHLCGWVGGARVRHHRLQVLDDD